MTLAGWFRDKVNKNGKFKREKVKENHRGKKGKKIAKRLRG